MKIPEYTKEELKNMKLCLVVLNGAVILVLIILGFVFGFDWRVFTGLLLGNVIVIGNFIGIGITSTEIARTKDEAKGRSIGRSSYMIRYIGTFAVLAVFTSLGVINAIVAVIPLFYIKIYYTFFYVLARRKDKKDD